MKLIYLFLQLSILDNCKRPCEFCNYLRTILKNWAFYANFALKKLPHPTEKSMFSRKFLVFSEYILIPPPLHLKYPNCLNV